MGLPPLCLILQLPSVYSDGVAEILDQEIPHGSIRRKQQKWRFRFKEHMDGVDTAR